MVEDRTGARWSDQPQSALERGDVTAAPVIGAVTDDFPGGGEVGSLQDGIEGLGVMGFGMG